MRNKTILDTSDLKERRTLNLSAPVSIVKMGHGRGFETQ